MNVETAIQDSANERPRAGRPRSLRALAGLAFLLALLLPPLLWRACRPAALGAAEIRTLMLTQQSWPKLLATAPLVDQFPPGYPCLLKAWNKLGKVARLPQGVAWSRLPGLLAWGAMAGAAWRLGRRLLGRAGGALLAWVLALGAPGFLSARTLGGEALASPALLVALLALLLAARTAGRPAAGLWMLYAVCAIAAFWTDRLAWPVLAAYGFLWLVTSIFSAFRTPHSTLEQSAIRNPQSAIENAGKMPALHNSAFRIPHSAFIQSAIRNPQSAIFLGLAAHLLVLLAGAPLFLRWPAEGGALAGLRRGWLELGGGWALARTLAVGHAAGLRPYYLLAPDSAVLLTYLSVGAVLLPAGLLLYRLLFYRNPPLDATGRGARTLALAGLGTAGLGFTLLRLGQRTAAGAALMAWPEFVFPGWTAWAAGVAGLALWATRRMEWPARRGWVALLPWLAASLAGQGVELRHELRATAELRQSIAAAGLANTARPLFVMPAELSPYVRGLFGSTPLRPLSGLAGLPAGQSDAVLLKLNPYPLLDFERDARAAALAGAGAFSRKVTRTPLPAGQGMELIRLEGIDRPRLEPLVNGGFQSPTTPPGK